MEKALKSAQSTRAAEAREGIGRGSRGSGFTSVQWHSATIHMVAGQEGPQEKQHPCSTKNTVRTVTIPLPSLAHLLTLGFPLSPPPWHLCPGSSMCVRHPVAVVGAGGGCGGDRLPPRVGAPGLWGSR